MDGTPALLTGTFASRYTVERELGRGASATVYLARDTHRGRAVAIKLLRPELAESLGAERFLREIKVNEKLHHPHIASVLDSGEHEGRLYFVLPHMEGGSLRQMLQREKQLPVEAAIAIARTVAEALDYAHKQGLIHRDVKPENILFTSGQACLVDFGIARAIERAIDESTTETGLVRGTPAYMSPEQASGSRNYDGRSDQYSLACVLYEMLAGVPAFLGATPEATIAMRFKHAPRELRVYRPTVPSAVEAVIQKALSITAADRYATSGEFSNALDTAMRAPQIEPRTSGSSVWNTPSRKWALGGAAVFAVALAAAASIGGRAIWGTKVPPIDTTKYFVLPIEGDAAAPRSQTYDLMLQALAKWKGVTVVDRFTARNALGSDTAVVNAPQALKAARGTGAGRYVRSRLTRSSTGLQLYGALFDAGEGTRLQEASISLPLSFARADSILDALADQLLLRGKQPVSLGSRALSAVELYQQSSEAREALSLRAADSLLLAALDADHDYGRAALDLAMVRTWQEEPASNWAPWAERAAASPQLNAPDRQMARALAAMGREDYVRACSEYQKLALERRQDFSLWYGLATCLRRDNFVMRDRRTASGWRFRSSYQQAVRAYVRAFELAPAFHRTFQAGAYDRLRRLLFTGAWTLRRGAAEAPDTTHFFAYSAWAGDSLVFVPYPSDLIQRERVPVDYAASAAAVTKQRDIFRSIARSWAVALPNNPATKEAVAISLEMFGDPAAIDTLEVARSLATDPLHRLRLASEQVLMRIGRGRNEPRQIEIAARLADSLIAETHPGSREEFGILRPIAALLGRCRLAGHFAAQSAEPKNSAALGIPHFAYAAAESLTVFSALGCDTPKDTAGLAFVEQSLAGGDRSGSVVARQRLAASILTRALRMAAHPDVGRLERLAKSGGDQLLATRYASLTGKPALVRSALERTRRSVGRRIADRAADAAYAEAILFVSLADSTSARDWLDPVLTRSSWLELMIDRPVDAAALLRATSLRAELAAGAGDKAGAKRWSAFVATLWTHADRELLPQVQRMRQFAN